MNSKEIRFAIEAIRHPEITTTRDFQEWMRDAEHAELYWNLLAVSDAMALEKGQAPDTDQAWAEMRARLLKSKRQQTKPMAVTHDAPARQKSHRHARLKVMFRWTAAAAVAIVGVMAVYHYWPSTAEEEPVRVVANQPKPSVPAIEKRLEKALPETPAKVVAYEVRTRQGQDTTFTMPDGTHVMLNADSRLCYNSDYGKDLRKVELRGEAYFDVKHDSHCPFVVSAKGVETRVLGTAFNVRAYPNADTHVTLVRGRVKVSLPLGKKIAVLAPGQDALMDGGGRIKVEDVNVERFTAWTQGYFYFEDTSLYEIMSEIGRWYNVDVEFMDSEAANLHFDFWSDRRQGLPQTIVLLEKLGKIHVELVGQSVRIASRHEFHNPQ